jgi:uncharacterized membrane protein YqiK
MQPEQTTINENKEIAQQAIAEKQENVSQETEEQINWKKFREQREIDRKHRVDAEKRAQDKEAEAEALKAAMEAILDKKSTNSVDNSRNQYSEEDLTEDQKIERRVDAAIEARERKSEKDRLQREQQEFPQRLVKDHKDFNEICTTENLDYLEYHYPEVAGPFKNLPDGYEKWTAVYKAVKRFVPNADSNKDKRKAEKNMAKPQSSSLPGVTQTGDTAPIQLDEKRRQDNWARMQRVMKGGR